MPPIKPFSGINPRAVKAFLEQPRDNWEWLKSWSNDALRRELLSLQPAPNVNDLMKQQLIGMLIGIAIRQFCFFYGPGSGKTLLILRLLEYFQRCGEFKKGVVFVPSVEAVYSWHDQIREWKSPLRPIPLAQGSSADKINEWLSYDDGLVLCAYPSFAAMASDAVQVKNRRTGKVKTKWVPNRKRIAAIFKGTHATIFDESTEIGNGDSLQAWCCDIAASHVGIRYGLAGRPYGRDPQVQWMQQKIVDGGISLGPTLGLMRATLFDATKSRFGGPYSFDYKLRKDRKADFARLAGHRSLIYKTEECVDLPELSIIMRRIPFPPETLEYYERIKAHLIENRTNKQAVNNDFLRMRQLGSGFLGLANDQFGVKSEFNFERNPKLDVMMELLNQFPEDTKIIIPHEFIISGQNICERLRKAKVKHVWMRGIRDPEARKKVYDTFRTDPECRVLVMQWSVGGIALNLQMATAMIVVEAPISVIYWDQLIRRFWRAGQKKRCILYYLAMIGGIEEKIHLYHKEGNDIFRELSRDPAKILG